MISLIQCYIHHHKGVEVNIAQPKTGMDYRLLNRMYNKVSNTTGWK